LYVALFQRLRALVAGRFKLPQGAEGFSIGGFVLTFAALSMSKYKLPHYVFITLPWAAVLTAAWLEKAFEHRRTAVVARVLLYIPAGVLLLGAGLLAYRVFSDPHLFVTFLMTVLTVSALFQAYRERRSADARGLVQLGGTALLAAVFVLNCHFYPNLLTYQQTSMVPQWVSVSDLDIPMDKLASGRRHGHAFDFYAGHICPRLTSVDAIKTYVKEHGTVFLYADDEVRGELNAEGVPYREVARFNHFQVALLKPAFLMPETREKALIPVYLLEVFEK
jgi:hypothetical protein